MPSVVNALLIIVFGIVYKRLALWLVKNENHRYE